ncbi:MAG: 5-deoxy-glucuronate isomerase [Clostridia bacterium]|nr:5-deoxy-glucuronate isomerase [Clostridia bacterium]
MLEVPQYNEHGEALICEMGRLHPEMGLTIRVKKLAAGEKLVLSSAENETAVLLLSGKLLFECRDIKETGERADPFEKKPFALHFSRNTQACFTALEASEILIEETDNEKEFPPVFYDPENCLYQEFGKGQWGGAGHRVVSTMFDLSNAPYSNMVMGEVFNMPGKWSSYPPHHHPQPEVYYYRFNPSQGFGACFIGDDVYKSTDGSCCFITPGSSHQQVTAPGYEMYYVWLIRHIDGDPWDKTRIYEPEHEWLASAL